MGKVFNPSGQLWFLCQVEFWSPRQQSQTSDIFPGQRLGYGDGVCTHLSAFGIPFFFFFLDLQPLVWSPASGIQYRSSLFAAELKESDAPLRRQELLGTPSRKLGHQSSCFLSIFYIPSSEVASLLCNLESFLIPGFQMRRA